MKCIFAVEFIIAVMETAFIIAVGLGVAVIMVILVLVFVLLYYRWRISDSNAHLEQFITENMELREKLCKLEMENNKNIIETEKKMKKIFLTLVAVFCFAMTVGFTSCNKSDDGTDEPKPSTEATPTMVAMTFTFNATADMVNFFDMLVTYDDGTGEKQETMTETQWKKTLKVKLPASFSFSRQCRVKADKYDTMVSTSKVTITSHYNYSYEILDAQGKAIPGKSGGNDLTHSTTDGSGTKVAERANSGGYDKSYAYSFDANGSMTLN